jgi:aspartyl-tRNA(Asn)/glutamyl-tRNA(Gln) amidotransferase subunit C
MKLEAIAHLARLHNTSRNLQHDLEQIVRMVDQIQAVQTEGIVPMSHPLETKLYYRPDLVTEPNEWAVLKKLAPKTEADLFLVPTVIE